MWMLIAGSRTFCASHEKLEKAHEIAQEAHKVLKNTLQKAYMIACDLQKKLNKIQET